MAASVWAKKPLVRASLTSAVGVVVLVVVWRLLGRSVSWTGIELQAGSLALAVTGAFVFLLGRAWRFWFLIPEQRRQPLQVLGLTGAGWGAGLLLPGPSGDVAFVALAHRVLGLTIARSSGIAVLARLFDLVSIALVAVLTAIVSETGEPAALGLAAFIGAAGVVMLAALLLRRPRRVLLRTVSRIPRLRGLTLRAEAGMSELSNRRTLSGVAAATVLCRLATAAQYAGLMSMVGIHLAFWETWFVLSLRTLLFTIPIQGIAGIGTSQAWWTSALLVEGVPFSVAVAASVTLQAVDLAVSLPIAALCSVPVLGRRMGSSRSRKISAATPIVTGALPAYSPSPSMSKQGTPVDGH